jgi:hypothetical protein
MISDEIKEKFINELDIKMSKFIEDIPEPLDVVFNNIDNSITFTSKGKPFVTVYPIDIEKKYDNTKHSWVFTASYPVVYHDDA